MFAPKVSVIVPVYNLEDYIERSINSLQNQTYQNLEIIIVDDGSLDSSLSIIEQLAATDTRIIYRSQPNGGAAKARNTGLSLVTGDYITFVDGDDMLSPNAISDNIGYFVDNKIDWVAFSIKRVDNDGRYITHNLMYNGITFKDTEEISSLNFIPYFYEERISGVACGAIYRRSSIQNIKFEEGFYYEDSIYVIDLLCTTEHAVLSNQGEYLYVERADSSQKAQMDFKHLTSSLYAINKRLLLFRRDFPQYENYYSKDERDFYYFLKNENAKGNDVVEPVLNEFKERIGPSFKRIWPMEFKILLYRVLGYNRIKKIINRFFH